LSAAQGAAFGSRLGAPDGRQQIRRFAEPALIAGALSAIYLILQPSSPDHAAQVFRSALFEHYGFAAWNNLWFGGHHLPGYGLLFPLLASLFGARQLAVLATVAAALLFAAIAYRRWDERARLGVLWFAAGLAISLFTGRLTFALGVPIGLGAVLAAQRGHRGASLLLAVLCPLASPVAGLFLACGALAYAVAERRRQGLELAAASAGTVILVSLYFPEGGSEPFVFSSFQPAILIALAAFLALPREERLLRYGVAAYVAALAGAFLIASPMGGNATRMGSLLLGPVLALALWRRQRFVLALLAPFIIYWQWSPVVRDLETVSAQPSVHPSYYAPLRDYLRGATRAQEYRVEVLPEVHHWEAAYVPRGIYIARGWERQLDRKLNPLFYDDKPLTAAAYRRWLDDLAVGFVAVPDAPLDYAAEAEARLISSGVPYLQPAFRSKDWTVYRVRDPTPLSTGAARLTKLKPEGFVLKASAAGTALVRVRWTPYWTVTAGFGCVEESPTGFTRVSIDRPGRLSVGVRFAPWRVGSAGPVCTHAGPDDGSGG
jgi:hypothetical protein